jgi:hypothetical protein
MFFCSRTCYLYLLECSFVLQIYVGCLRAQRQVGALGALNHRGALLFLYTYLFLLLRRGGGSAVLSDSCLAWKPFGFIA